MKFRKDSRNGIEMISLNAICGKYNIGLAHGNKLLNRKYHWKGMYEHKGITYISHYIRFYKWCIAIDLINRGE